MPSLKKALLETWKLLPLTVIMGVPLHSVQDLSACAQSKRQAPQMWVQLWAGSRQHALCSSRHQATRAASTHHAKQHDPQPSLARVQAHSAKEEPHSTMQRPWQHRGVSKQRREASLCSPGLAQVEQTPAFIVVAR